LGNFELRSHDASPSTERGKELLHWIKSRHEIDFIQQKNLFPSLNVNGKGKVSWLQSSKLPRPVLDTIIKEINYFL